MTTTIRVPKTYETFSYYTSVHEHLITPTLQSCNNPPQARPVVQCCNLVHLAKSSLAIVPTAKNVRKARVVTRGRSSSRSRPLEISRNHDYSVSPGSACFAYNEMAIYHETRPLETIHVACSCERPRIRPAAIQHWQRLNRNLSPQTNRYMYHDLPHRAIAPFHYSPGLIRGLRRAWSLFSVCLAIDAEGLIRRNTCIARDRTSRAPINALVVCHRLPRIRSRLRRRPAEIRSCR